MFDRGICKQCYIFQYAYCGEYVQVYSLQLILGLFESVKANNINDRLIGLENTDKL